MFKHSHTCPKFPNPMEVRTKNSKKVLYTKTRRLSERDRENHFEREKKLRPSKMSEEQIKV